MYATAEGECFKCDIDVKIIIIIHILVRFQTYISYPLKIVKNSMSQL